MTRQPKSTADSASTEELKLPRGGKLDQQMRSEYAAEVNQSDGWDVSGWTQWAVTGRVLPERCDVNFGPIQSQGIGAGGRFRLRLQVQMSLLSATCQCEKTDTSIFEIAEMVEGAATFPVDYIAFRNRAAYVTILDQCINIQTGVSSLIPVYEPLFEPADVGLCFDVQADRSMIFMPWKEASVFEFPTALHDLAQAIEYPRRTFEYCRMAVEVIRRHFDPPEIKDHKRRQSAGELSMCAALKVTRDAITSLDAVAARSRHGDLVFSMNWERRKRAMELAWELVARFECHLQGKSNEQMKLLDLKVGP